MKLQDKVNKRIAQAVLLRYIGADSVLEMFAKEAQEEKDDFYLECFESHLDELERALSDVMHYSKKLKDEVTALRGRIARKAGKV
jgi:hypothetical protein